MTILFTVAQLVLLIVVLGFIYRPLGDYMAHIFESPKDLRVERRFYRLIGVDSASGQTWQAYLRSVLAFSAVGMLALYGLQRMQEWLPYSLGLSAVDPDLAYNTAASFVGNTNWQSYAPESTVGYSVQMGGLAVQNFVSAAVGICVAIAVIRGFSLRKSSTIGNFWVDITRSILRLLIPIL